jgi:two-component system chemotaxis response regulator CheY
MIEYSVLVIDDDIWMQRILAKTLQSYGFTKTYLASDGFEGVGLAVENLPNLIIMDILMPELSGHLTLKIIKHINCTKDIPVLMVSALSDSENLKMAVKSGTAGFISKPFTRATIYEKLINIYGKDKLDLIAKGEPIDNDFDYYYDDMSMDNKLLSDNSTLLQNPEIGITPESIDKSVQKVSIQQTQLLQTYQDDEKRNIESIKKLLSKVKK